jgi:hypothetical protein
MNGHVDDVFNLGGGGGAELESVVNEKLRIKHLIFIHDKLLLLYLFSVGGCQQGGAS